MARRPRVSKNGSSYEPRYVLFSQHWGPVPSRQKNITQYTHNTNDNHTNHGRRRRPPMEAFRGICSHDITPNDVLLDLLSKYTTSQIFIPAGSPWVNLTRWCLYCRHTNGHLRNNKLVGGGEKEISAAYNMFSNGGNECALLLLVVVVVDILCISCPQLLT